MINNVILIALGVACVAWTTGLVFWVVIADNRQRRAIREVMAEALSSMIRRTGELRRPQQTWVEPKSPF